MIKYMCDVCTVQNFHYLWQCIHAVHFTKDFLRLRTYIHSNITLLQTGLIFPLLKF